VNTITDVENYLAAMAKVERARSGVAKAPIALPFVTISRQAGAGAYRLAATLVQIMQTEKDAALFHGWQLLDRQLCRDLMHHEGVQGSMQSLLSEHYHSQISEFVSGLFGRHMPQDTAVMHQSKLIRSMASLGKVIVIGRAGSQAAKALPQGLHIRLVASEQVRIRSLLERQLDKDEKDVRRMLHEQDQERARLLKDHYRVDIDDPLLYDAVWNSASVDMEAIARAIIAVIQQRWRAS
jgi:cytidylate kinase